MSKYDQPNNMSRAVQQAVNTATPGAVTVDGYIGDATVIAVRNLVKELVDLRVQIKTAPTEKQRATVAIENIAAALDDPGKSAQAIEAIKQALAEIQ